MFTHDVLWGHRGSGVITPPIVNFSVDGGEW
jgi:hypothetical protein